MIIVIGLNFILHSFFILYFILLYVQLLCIIIYLIKLFNNIILNIFDI